MAVINVVYREGPTALPLTGLGMLWRISGRQVQAVIGRQAVGIDLDEVLLELVADEVVGGRQGNGVAGAIDNHGVVK